MDLNALGLQHWLADAPREACAPGRSIARVTAVDRGRYLVHGEAGEVPATLTGKFLHQATSAAELPCVGDWVCVHDRDAGAQASIHQLLPRRTFLRRKAAGRDVEFQMLAANIDLAFIVQSCHFDFNLRRLERTLVMVADGHIEPVLLLTKTDLVSPETLDQQVAQIRAMGVVAPIVCISNRTGSGVEQVRSLIVPGQTCCLLGSSGVGKTTLINRLLGGVALETRAVSRSGEGRHTTTRRHLMVLDGGGLLIDMPGIRELGMLGAQAGIEQTFADIDALARRCRYPDCRHTSEPGCAVRAAIERHELSEDHLQHHRKLQKESEFHDLSHLERRRKDRAFGRFVRNVKKHGAGPDRG